MNKKVIIGIIATIVVAVLGIAGYMLSGNNNKSNIEIEREKFNK